MTFRVHSSSIGGLTLFLGGIFWSLCVLPQQAWTFTSPHLLHKQNIRPENVRPSNDVNRSQKGQSTFHSNPSHIKNNKCPSSSSSLHLIPLSEFGSEICFLNRSNSIRLCFDTKGQLNPKLNEHFNNNNGQHEDNNDNHNHNNDNQNPYVLCVAEEDDLAAISRLTVDAFGVSTVTLSNGMNEWERALLGPTVGLANEFSDIVAYTEVLSGLRNRMKSRMENHAMTIAPPKVSSLDRIEAFDLAAKSSLILVIARKINSNSQDESSSVMDLDCLATVELRLQPTDGKIPFSHPWMDRWERRIAKRLRLNPPNVDKQLQPYLSNLCVAPKARGQRLGKALVRCVESIATETWGYKKLYLHVELENIPALNLYKREGFHDVGLRWSPFWAGKAADIAYFVKEFKRRT